MKKIVWYLERPDELEKVRQKGMEMSKIWTQETYAKQFYQQINKIIPDRKKYKLFINAENGCAPEIRKNED